jgi:hypothetical protein
MKIRPASSFLDLDTAMNMVKEFNSLKKAQQYKEHKTHKEEVKVKRVIK